MRISTTTALSLVLSVVFFVCGLATVTADSAPSSHLKYFGFALVDVGWDDPNDPETTTNYADEVRGFSNCGDILAVGPADDIRARLDVFKSKGLRAIIHVSSLFFEVSGNSGPSGTDYALRADYQSRWQDFVILNELTSRQSALLCIYLGEEPTWNSISFADLEDASDRIKADLPSVPTLIIEAYPAVSSLQVPLSVDWIGFDHYFIKDPRNDAGYLSELALLKSKKSQPGQKLVIVMDSHYISGAHGAAGIALGDLGKVAQSYYQLAREEPDVIALFGYVWPGGFGGAGVKGARNMDASTKKIYADIGRAITGK